MKEYECTAITMKSQAEIIILLRELFRRLSATFIKIN